MLRPTQLKDHSINKFKICGPIRPFSNFMAVQTSESEVELQDADIEPVDKFLVECLTNDQKFLLESQIKKIMENEA